MAEDIVETAERRAHRRRPGVHVTTDMPPEEPEQALTRESHSALAVVLGHRGRGGMTEAILGSVGVTVAEQAQPGRRGPGTGQVPGLSAARTCPGVVLCGSHDGQARPGSAAGPSSASTRSPRARRPCGSPRRRPACAGFPWAVPVSRHRHPAGERRAGVGRRPGAGRGAAGRPGRPGGAAAHRGGPSPRRPAGCLRRCRPAGRGHFGPRLGRVVCGVLHHAACPVAVVPELS
ncbi:universal stress protein [Streptomyces sp. NPDC001450]